MKLYSAEEIEKDIFEFEGVEIVLPKSPATDPRLSKLKGCFRMKYSHWAGVPMASGKTVDELKKRVFLYSKLYGCPKCDISPFDSKTITIYYLPFEGSELIRVHTADTMQEFTPEADAFMESEKINEAVAVFIIVKQADDSIRVTQMTRNLH